MEGAGRAWHHVEATAAVTIAPALENTSLRWSSASATMLSDRPASRTHKKYSPSFRSVAAPRIANIASPRCSSGGFPARGGRRDA